MRRCWKCKEVKPLTEFYVFHKDKEGRQKACKACQRKRNFIYARAHREYFKQKGREKYNPAHNAARYKRYRKSYLRRRAEYSMTVRGRLRSIFNAAQDRARRHNWLFAIDFDWILGLCSQQSGKCKLTGISFTYERNPNSERFYFPYSPSLDRIDSSKGYIKDNVRLVCVVVNLALNRFGEDVLQKMCVGYLQQHGWKVEQKIEG